MNNALSILKVSHSVRADVPALYFQETLMDNHNVDSRDPLILVYDAPNQVTAELVCATLQASGLQAVVQNQYTGPAAGWLTYLSNTNSRGVLVPTSEADAARMVLDARQPTDEELAAEIDADPLTIEEAEAQVK